MRVLATVFVVLLMGCQTPDRAVRAVNGERHDAKVTAHEVWLPTPVAVRVYPSTRFVREGDRVLLEARIELLDAMGDPVKWPGRARLELLAATSTRPIRTTGRLFGWSVDLRSRKQQGSHYDPVTRTYFFRLMIDDATVTERPTVLRAEYSPPDTPRVSDEAVVGEMRLEP
ncbi:MAG: hypothetical protein ACOC1G_03255 [Phycisphaeraceae bacterium]